MKHLNAMIIGAALVFCVAAAILGLVFHNQTAAPATTSPVLAAMPAGAENANAFVIVTVGDVVYQPYPLHADGEYTVAQENGDTNVIQIAKDGVRMAFSSCHNQDCVQQGSVTLASRESRPLGNKIICLPNKVVLAVCTPEEAENLLALP